MSGVRPPVWGGWSWGFAALGTWPTFFSSGANGRVLQGKEEASGIQLYLEKATSLLD